jgi:Flp pilus assembly protein TadD
MAKRAQRKKMPPRRTPRYLGWLAAGAILAAALLAYIPALRAGFIWDDHELVSLNPDLRGPVWRIWFAPTADDYWPLTWTAFWFQLRLFGLEPTYFHLTNVLLHAATSLLLWRVVRALGIPGAWLAGLLFAVHPVTVESVAFVSELKNVLSAVPALAAALLWIRFLDQGRRRDLFLAYLLFAAALLAKTSVVMLPVVLLVVASLRRGRLVRNEVLAATPLFALSAAAGTATLFFQYRLAMLGEGSGRGIAERIGGAGWALWSYVEKAVLPVRVGILYDPWPVGPGSPLFLLPFVAAVLAAALLWWFRQRLEPLGLALGFQALMLLPVLGLVDLAFLGVSPVSNHLQYVPLMGPVVLVAWGLDRVRHRWKPAVALAPLCVVALGLSTFSRAAAFESDLSLFERAVRDAPDNPMARSMLGSQLERAGRPIEAAAQFDTLAARAPDRVWLLVGRMYAHYFRGQATLAAVDAQGIVSATTQLLPRRRAANMLLATGNVAEALTVLQDLVARAPTNAEFSNAYASTLIFAGRVQEGADVLGAWCRNRPGHPGMEREYAAVLLRLGDVREARVRAATVLGTSPDDAQVTALLQALVPAAVGR